jgi:pimeloyl-ACP methyl ester carboxylesterase
MDAQTITRPDGRHVAFDVHGPADGPVVLLCHAAPGSRRFDPDPAATTAAGVRLVTVDRPGYGGSDPVSRGIVPTIPVSADDAAAVLDHLGVRSAVLAGWSAGGRVAAALAAARPDVASALFLIATPAPDDDVPWVDDTYRPAIAAMRSAPADAVDMMVANLTAATGGDEGGDGDATVLVTGGPADERALAADGALRDRVVAMVAEAMAQGPVGTAADIVAYTVADWGFDPAAIGAPTTCVYGADDTLVPPAHGEWWAARIPAARVEVVDGAGHLVVVPAWPRVLAAAGPT